VLLTPVANLPQVSLTPVVPVAKFAASVIDTRGKFANLSCEYLCEFKKKFEMTIMLFLGARGKAIHEKNLKQKIL
jgi:hypothetical protein